LKANAINYSKLKEFLSESSFPDLIFGQPQ